MNDRTNNKEDKELKQDRLSLLNILEDSEEARKKSEEERNKSLSIVRHLVDGLLYFDEKHKLVLANPKAEEILGVKKKELMNKCISEIVKIPTFKPFEKLLSKNIQNIVKRKVEVNKELILEVSVIPIDIAKKGTGTLMIFHDISREKRIERLKTEFVSLVAHQLRTPLSGAKWALRMILDGEAGKPTQDQVNFLEKIYQSNERMIKLIDELLDITRIEEGKYLHNPTFTDMESIVQFVFTSRKKQASIKNLKFVFKRSKKLLPRVKVDVSKIKSALENLIDNAINYTLKDGEVTISLNQVGSEVVCSVKDSGVGIFEEEQARVFSKFFRGSNVVRLETDGSGLGLFITKNVIEAHGGRIWFESAPGKGTTFYFTLPVEGSEFIL